MRGLSARLWPLNSKLKLAGINRTGRSPIYHSPRRGCCHETGDDEEFSSLSEEQRKQVYAGIYPTDFPAEAIRIKSIGQEFSLLLDKFNSPESDRGKATRVSFNRMLLATSILQLPTPIHEQVIGAAQNEIIRPFMARNLKIPFILDTNLPFDIGRDDSNTVCIVPDLALSSRNRSPFLALEAGFSERYDDLVDSAKLLLNESPKTKTVVLIKIHEKPIFRPPLRLMDFLSQPRSAIPIPADPTAEDCYLSNSNDPESPIMLNGLKWVGRISAFWEIWSRDISGNPTINGERVWFYGADATPAILKIDLTDLTADATEIVIKNSILAEAIHESRARLALNRCYGFLRALSDKKKKASASNGTKGN